MSVGEGMERGDGGLAEASKERDKCFVRSLPLGACTDLASAK